MLDRIIKWIFGIRKRPPLKRIEEISDKQLLGLAKEIIEQMIVHSGSVMTNVKLLKTTRNKNKGPIFYAPDTSTIYINASMPHVIREAIKSRPHLEIRDVVILYGAHEIGHARTGEEDWETMLRIYHRHEDLLCYIMDKKHRSWRDRDRAFHSLNGMMNSQIRLEYLASSIGREYILEHDPHLVELYDDMQRINKNNYIEHYKDLEKVVSSWFTATPH